jgi:hypothetical protein
MWLSHSRAPCVSAVELRSDLLDHLAHEPAEARILLGDDQDAVLV